MNKFSVRILPILLHLVRRNAVSRDVLELFCLHLQFSRCITFKINAKQELLPIEEKDVFSNLRKTVFS